MKTLKPSRAELLDPTDELPPGASDFERAHHFGARRHTALWAKANHVAVDLAILNGIDYTTPAMKTLLSQVVLRVLDVAATGKTGRI